MRLFPLAHIHPPTTDEAQPGAADANAAGLKGEGGAAVNAGVQGSAGGETAESGGNLATKRPGLVDLIPSLIGASSLVGLMTLVVAKSSVSLVTAATLMLGSASLVGTAVGLWRLWTRGRGHQEQLIAVRRERDLLQQLVHAEPACVKTVSRDLRLLDINPAGLRMIGAPSMEAVRGASLEQVIHPQHLRQFRHLNERVFNGESVSEQFRIISLDGTLRWMETHAAPLHDETGHVRSHLAVTYDISERVALDRELRATSSRLEALIDTAADAILVLDRSGQVERVNPTAREMFGATTEEFLSVNLMELVAEPEAREQGFDAFVGSLGDRSATQKLRGSSDATFRTRDGEEFPVRLSIGEVGERAGGGFMVLVQDMSDLVRAQTQLAQAQKMEAIGQLSGGIAHDFNNLLTVITGNAAMLEEMVGDEELPVEEFREMAQMILDAGTRGESLTARLLAFGRRQVLQPVSTQCDVLVKEMRGWLGRTIRDDIDVKISLESDLLPVFADRSQLDTALLNLALNAQDAMPQGGELTFSAHNLALVSGKEADDLELAPGRYVVLSVTDNGVGMPDAVRHRALDPFFTTKETGKGTGLGLSMVYGFTRQSGGEVSIESAEGYGTTVRLYLPAAGDQDLAGLFREEVETAAASTGGARVAPQTVLVVEDDAMVRAYVMASLRSFGHRAVSVSNGQEAIDLLGEGIDFSLVITDAVMPGGVTGLEVSNYAQANHPNIPVILMSGYATDLLEQQGRITTDVPFLKKPFQKDDLERIVRREVERAQAKRTQVMPAVSASYRAPMDSSSRWVPAVKSPRG